MRLGALLAVTLAGLAAVAVSGYYLSQDWAALNAAYARCEKLTMSAEAHQNACRINCVADGVGVLLGAILAAVGLHGLCLLCGGRPRGQ